MADNTITITLQADGNATQVINKVVKSLSDVEKASESAGFSFTRAFETLTGILGGNLLANGISNLAGKIASLGEELIKSGVESAIEAQNAINDLNFALAASGNFTEDASKAFQKYAKDIERTTTVQDDAVISTGALIARLTGLSDKALQDATTAALDYSAALNKDLNTAATLVSKAINGNEEALGKVGIKFNVAKGAAVDFSTILSAIEGKFGGSAVAKVNTFEGAITILENAFNKLKQSIGEIVITNPVLVESIKKLTGIFFALVTGVEQNSKSFGESLSNAIIGAIKTFSLFVLGIEQVVNAFQRLDAIIQLGAVTIYGALYSVVGVVALALPYAFTKLLEVIRFVMTSAASAVEPFSSSISEALNKAIEPLNKQIEYGKSLTSGFKSGLSEIGSEMETLSNKAHKGTVDTEGFRTELDKLAGSLDQIKSKKIELPKPDNSAKSSITALREELKLSIQEFEALAQAGQKSIETISGQFEIKNEANQAQFDQEIISQEEFLARKQELLDEEFNAASARNTALHSEGLLSDQSYYNAKIALENNYTKRSDALKKDLLEKEKLYNKLRLQSTADTFGNLATLMQTGNRTLFEIGRAAAISQAIVNTFIGVSNALAGPPTGPPFPFNIALAVSQGVALGVQVAKLASATPQGFASGITEVPKGFPNDSFPARLTSGERVVDSATNQDLKQFLANGGNAALLLSINDKLAALQNTTVVNIGNREIVREVRNALQDGRSLVTT